MAKLGENRLGSFQFSQPAVFEIEDDEVRDRADDVMKTPFPTHDGTTWDKVLATILTNAEIQNELVADLVDERFVDTATQKQLGMIGELFGVDRRPDEGDVHFRARIKSQLPRNTTSTTIDEVLRISAELLNTDPQRLTLIEDHDVEPARFDIHVEDIVFDDSTITVSDFETLLQDVRAAGVKANATIGQQFTHRSVDDYDNGVNSADKAYGGYTDSSINSKTGEPDTLVDDPTLLDTGGPYADEITQQLT